MYLNCGARRGVKGLTVEDDKDRRGKPALAPETEDRKVEKPRRKRAPVPEVGQALRSVYQRTVDETIPPEMLDLLGKLG